MCLILIAETKQQILALPLHQAWKINHDGAGIMFIRDDNLVTIKGLMHFGQFERALKNVPKGVGVAIHFRAASHGAVNATNTHPFRMDKHSALMHNGMISGLGSHGEKGDSDTAAAARILSHLPHDERLELLESWSNTNRFVYANVQEGGFFWVGNFTEQNGVLMSNTYWRTSVIHHGRATHPSISKWDSTNTKPVRDFDLPLGFHSRPDDFDSDDLDSTETWELPSGKVTVKSPPKPSNGDMDKHIEGYRRDALALLESRSTQTAITATLEAHETESPVTGSANGLEDGPVSEIITPSDVPSDDLN